MLLLFKSAPESKSSLIKEHKRLVAVLRSPSHEDDLEEADKQEEELEEYMGKAIHVLLYDVDALLAKGGKGSGNFHHKGREGERGGSAKGENLHLIEESLRSHAMPWRHLDFSETAWAQEFPEGSVDTPIGRIKLGESQHDKMSSLGRKHYFGLIRPTLENPTYVISTLETKEQIQQRTEKGEDPKRAAKLEFIRAFIKPDGKHQGFLCVTVDRGGVEVSISSGPRRLGELARKIRRGAILALDLPYQGSPQALGVEDGFSKAVSYFQFTQDWIDFKPGILAKAITPGRADTALKYRLDMIAAQMGPLAARVGFDPEAKARYEALAQERYTIMIAMGEASI